MRNRIRIGEKSENGDEKPTAASGALGKWRPHGRTAIASGNASFPGKGGKPVSMCFRCIALLFLVSLCGLSYAESMIGGDFSVEIGSDSEIVVKSSGDRRRCSVEKKPVGLRLSSDRELVIVLGTSYIPVDELMRCKPEVVVRAKKAAPHVGFLSDVNLRAGIYASLVPVSLNPMSFLVVVAKIGSDKNIVNLPGFYMAGMRSSKMRREASSNVLPVISLDGRYVSMSLHSCGSNEYVDVVEIRSRKWTRIERASCEKLFNFQ
ncbi:hypothetical protein [Cupriavidus basilensis]|uniref:hypothetical protein n=1 Tax=Cupriavidus basilensis TaxID=68895 RepID=UPI00157B6991|nr:hypothetical protein [Cupriavidus basilensis]NUA28133.1 hypothetical protein [Cupriavidus basilensis]